MNGSYWLGTFAAAFLGMVAGINIGSTRSDDIVKAKSVVIVDSDGQSFIEMDAQGITLKGKEDGDSIILAAGSTPEMSFAHKGRDAMQMGVSDTGRVGLNLLHDGVLYCQLAAKGQQSLLVMGSQTGETDGDQSSSPRISLYSSPNRTAMEISDGTGKKKTFTPDGG
ncbi:MAG: hypothetical protein QOJ65_2641 [Fimbriimonadaceae bacterium]|nr:hypothetical protein [Fimbriimonadaceae bacterium]